MSIGAIVIELRARTDKHTAIQTERQTERQTDIQTDKQVDTYIHADIHTNRYTYKQTYLQTDIQYLQAYTQTDTGNHTHIQALALLYMSETDNLYLFIYLLCHIYPGVSHASVRRTVFPGAPALHSRQNKHQSVYIHF